MKQPLLHCRSQKSQRPKLTLTVPQLRWEIRLWFRRNRIQPRQPLMGTSTLLTPQFKQLEKTRWWSQMLRVPRLQMKPPTLILTTNWMMTPPMITTMCKWCLSLNLETKFLTRTQLSNPIKLRHWPLRMLKLELQPMQTKLAVELLLTLREPLTTTRLEIASPKVILRVLLPPMIWYPFQRATL